MKTKTTFLLVGTLFFCAATSFVLVFAHPRLDSNPSQLSAEQSYLLWHLGLQALESSDVPVAALLLYKDEIIGRGFNTVRRDQDPAGHAEVNAIRDAFSKLGTDGYEALDPSKLLMISTFEPCPMCRGAMQLHKISHAQFERAKPVTQLLREQLKMLRYQFNREKVGPEGLQESLFWLHPSYFKSQSPKTKANH